MRSVEQKRCFFRTFVHYSIIFFEKRRVKEYLFSYKYFFPYCVVPVCRAVFRLTQHNVYPHCRNKEYKRCKCIRIKKVEHVKMYSTLSVGVDGFEPPTLPTRRNAQNQLI